LIDPSDFRGEEDDRNAHLARNLAEFTDHRQAVHDGHVEIGDNQIVMAGGRFGDSFGSINCFGDGVAGIGQSHIGGQSNACGVVDGQNVRSH
jgi:hypothetical protein